MVLCATPARAGWWDDAGRARETTIERLARERQDGTVAEDLPHVVAAQVLVTRQPGERTEGHVVLHASGAGTALRARVRPGTAAARALATLDAEAVQQIHLVVRTRDGTRVVEVLRFTAPDGPLTPEEEGDLRRARRFQSAGNARAASRLLTALLGRRAHAEATRIELLTELGAALTAQRRLPEALNAYHRVLQLAPRNQVARTEILRLSEKPPERTVDAAPAEVVPAGRGATRPPEGRGTGLDDAPLPPAPGLAPAGGRPAPPPRVTPESVPPRPDAPRTRPPAPATRSETPAPGADEEPPPPPPPGLSGPR